MEPDAGATADDGDERDDRRDPCTPLPVGVGGRPDTREDTGADTDEAGERHERRDPAEHRATTDHGGRRQRRREQRDGETEQRGRRSRRRRPPMPVGVLAHRRSLPHDPSESATTGRRGVGRRRRGCGRLTVTGVLTRSLRTDRPLHLVQTVAPLRVHASDPTMRVARNEAVRSSRTPDGPATVAVKVWPDGRIEAGAWGPGATFALDALPDLLGERDARDGFDAALHPVVATADRRQPGLRICRTGDVEDLVVPTILGQRVTGKEATSSWAGLVRAHGEGAPGPHEGLLLRPPADWYRAQPEHVYRRLGVELQRERTIREASRHAARLQEAASMGPAAALARLQQVRGIGIWTAAIVARYAFGDPDPVEVGDYHVPNGIAWALAGEPRATDERMLELLAPWQGHRGRVVRLLKADSRVAAPKYGARGVISNSATIARQRAAGRADRGRRRRR